MAIRLYKAYTPGTRNRTVSTFGEITHSKPERSLLTKKHRRKGHNNRGIIRNVTELLILKDIKSKSLVK